MPETREEIGPSARFWLDQIDQAGKRDDEKAWRKEGDEVVERYKAEKKKRGFNILWSNVETLKPSVYARAPVPNVTRRFHDQDPVGKLASDILERGLSFIVDDPEFGVHECLKMVRDDNLLPGRGLARVKFKAPIERVGLDQVPGEFGLSKFFLGDQEVTPDGDEDGQFFIERISRRTLHLEYVYWKDYREGPARVWEDVPWTAYRHLMTRAQLRKAFGQVGSLVPLNHKPDKKDDEPDHPLAKAIVWEIWDKEERERLWVAEGFNDQVLDTDDDPLGLQGFFPHPDPLYAIRTSDSRTPVPEYRVYKDQADELDRITYRIGKLIEAVKVRGVYASVVKEIQNLLDGEENELFPVDDWAALRDRGGLEGAFAFLPIEQMARVLVALYEQRERLKQEIFELTGLSDIIRGSSDPRETATAQGLKGSFGTVRMQPRREPMEMFIRGTLRIMAEVLAEHFEAEDLQMMTGKPVPPEVMQLLRDDKMRGFRIDIETDSTVQADEEREQQNVVEFLGATSQYFQTAAEVAQIGGGPALKMMMEAYKAGARRFKMGRELEGVIEESVDELVQAASQPRPDPAQQEAQADMQAKQAELQFKQQVAQLESQIRQQQSQMDLIIKKVEAEAGVQIKRAEKEAQMEIERDKAINDAEIARVKAANDMQIARENAN